MTIKIVLPESDGLRASHGTKVYTDSGHEIQNISRIQMDILPDNILEATITVAVSEIENLAGIEGVIWPELDNRKVEAVVELGGEMLSAYNECSRYEIRGSDIVDTWSYEDRFVMSEKELMFYAKILGYRQ